ncbi:hypothetical protein CK203_080684 [Vitis vinifera]|uniref:DUF4283 domain-containing protein n=1 Tax=Vitis vinifera TaxID=29760 RepID=A0A438DZ93_VITVI|nr:hypothetical protein CK203_080684 [Vitis vinifera]
MGGSLIEMEERCGHEVILKETEEGLSINPLSMRLAEERMGEKSTSGLFPLKEGRKEWGEEEENDMESWNYSCLAKFCHCLGMPTEGYERDILKLLYKMRDRRDRRVYGPSVKVEKEEFLSELGAIKGLWNEPWCVAGDFNMIRFPSERSRGGRLSPSMRRFTEVIEELELRDLPLQGGCSRGVELDQYQIILQLFLMEGDEERAHTFQIREHVAEGGRLQRGAEEMVGGDPEVFGQIKVKKQEAWNSLDFWDKEERVRELSLEEEEARKEAREMYKKWVLLEERHGGRSPGKFG